MFVAFELFGLLGLLGLPDASAAPLPSEPFDLSKMRVDLVENGGMEVGTVQNVLNTWAPEGVTGGLLQRSDARAFQGMRSARLSPIAPVASTGISSITQTLVAELQSQQTYVVSAMVWTKLAHPDATAFLDLADQQWAEVGGAFGDCERRSTRTRQGWELLECWFKASRNPPIVKLRVGVRGPLEVGDDVFFDHVALTHGSRYHPPLDVDFDHDGDGYSTLQGDCDERSATIRPNAQEIWYDGIDQNCDDQDDYDRDGDGDRGAAYGGGDCNDNNPAVSSLAEEIWYDGADQDCDGADDFDQDGDGHAAEADGYTGPLPADDCDDTDPDAHPGAEELPGDGVDQDCDGADGEAGPTRPYDSGEPQQEPVEGCKCASGANGAPPILVLLLPLVGLRRRR